MTRRWDELFVGLDAAGDAGAVATAEQDAATSDDAKSGWMRRLRENLSRSRQAMTAQFAAVVFDVDDAELWERIEEGLIAADCGVNATVEIVGRLEAVARERSLTTGGQLAGALREIVVDVLSTGQRESIDVRPDPAVIVMVGVNGTGKTTTVGKLAARLAQHGRGVIVGAGDTFRAAAVEQLEEWANRANARFVRTRDGGDPAAVAFDAIDAAEPGRGDIVIIDTAGRLHTKSNLMAELEKVTRVIGSKVEGAPHEVLLSIDATTGQNGLRQAQEFAAAAGVTGVVLTKLDGSAKGGVAIAIAHDLGIPVKLVGIGESLDDLQPFDAADFAAALFPDDLLGAGVSA